MRIDTDRGTVEICGKKIYWRERQKVIHRKLEQFIVWEQHCGNYHQIQIEPDLMDGIPVDSFLIFRCKKLVSIKIRPCWRKISRMDKTWPDKTFPELVSIYAKRFGEYLGKSNGLHASTGPGEFKTFGRRISLTEKIIKANQDYLIFLEF